jgi:hypothetical protein
VTATHVLTKELYMTSLKVLTGNNRLCILFISDDITESTKELINSLKLAGADVYQIMSEDEISDVLMAKAI